jgi:hypothetical protein
MKALTAALLVLVAACGEGRAIFNVDAHSFMTGMGNDTIPYAIPPASSGSASTFQEILLPGGFGSSVVDSVRITTGSADLQNSGGTGTIGFELYFDSTQAGTLTASPALIIPATSVSGTDTVSVPISGDLSSAVNSLFTQDTLWMRIAVTGNNPGATPVTGQGVLTSLVIRIVLQDKIF